MISPELYLSVISTFDHIRSYFDCLIRVQHKNSRNLIYILTIFGECLGWPFLAKARNVKKFRSPNFGVTISSDPLFFSARFNEY